MGGITGANIAYKLTAEGAEAVIAAFNSIGAAAGGSFGALSPGMQGVNNDLANVTNGLAGAAKSAGLLRDSILAIGTAGTFGYTIENSLHLASNIETMSKQAAMSTTEFQEWSYALEQFNITQDSTATGLKMLAENAAQFVTQNTGPAKNAFGVLGMSQADVQQAMKDESSFFALILQKLGEVKNSAEQIDLSKQIFGKQTGPDLIEPIQAGIDVLQEYREEAEQLGIVFSEDTVEGARKAEVEINSLETILHDKLAIAIDENADKIAHMAEMAIDHLPDVVTIADDIGTAFGWASDRVADMYVGLYDIWMIAQKVHDATENSWMNFHLPGQPSMKDMMGNNAPQVAGTPDLPVLSGYERTGVGAPPSQTNTGPTAADLENTLFGTDSSSGYGSAPDIGDPAAAKAAEKQAEANQKVIDSLQSEVTAMNESDRQMAISTAERKLNATATDDQRQEVEDLAGSLYDEKQRMADVKEASKDISDAFNDMTMKGEKLGDVLKNLATQLLQLAEKDLFGNTATNGITNLLNGAVGLFSGGSSYNPATSAPPVKPPVPPGLAAGGDASAGNLYTVNEDGMEYFQPSVDGQVIPLGGQTGMTVTVNNYANANVQALQNGNGLEIRVTNLEQGLQQVNGSIETRALAATQQMFLRSTTFLRT